MTVRIPAGGLARIDQCLGSLLAEDGEKVDRSSENREDGILAHSWCEAKLKGEDIPQVDEGMEIYCREYTDYVESLEGELKVELSFNVPEIHDMCNARLDTCIIGCGKVTIVDFKYGYKLINPDNYTMKAYASGLQSLLGFPDDWNLELVIVQPRPYHPLGHIRTHETTFGGIKSDIRYLRQRISQALIPEQGFKTGPSCYHCPRAHKCEALNESTYNAVDMAHDNVEVSEFSDASLEQCLDNLERAQEVLKLRVDTLRELAEMRLREGKRLKLYNMSPGKTFVKWKDKEVAEGVAKISGVDIIKTSIMTPKQALLAGLTEGQIDKLTEKGRYPDRITRSNHSLAQALFNKEV